VEKTCCTCIIGKLSPYEDGRHPRGGTTSIITFDPKEITSKKREKGEVQKGKGICPQRCTACRGSFLRLTDQKSLLSRISSKPTTRVRSRRKERRKTTLMSEEREKREKRKNRMCYHLEGKKEGDGPSFLPSDRGFTP